MNQKKLVVAGILALVVIGCIFAAGCTTTTVEEDPVVNTTVSTPAFSGTWTSADDDGIQYTHVFYADGTGKNYELYDDKYMRSLPFTWKQSDNVVDVMYDSGDDGQFVYHESDKTLKKEDGSTYTKTADAIQDPVVKTWISQADTSDMRLRVFKWDGSGMDVEKTGTGPVNVYPFTWKKAGETYTVTYPDGTYATMTLNATGTTLTCSYEKGMAVSTEYKDYHNTSWDPVVGVWDGYHIDDEGKYQSRIVILVANGDGTLYDVNPDGSLYRKPFTWIKNGTNYTVTYENGTSENIIYDSSDDTINYPGGTVLKKSV